MTQPAQQTQVPLASIVTKLQDTIGRQALEIAALTVGIEMKDAELAALKQFISQLPRIQMVEQPPPPPEEPTLPPGHDAPQEPNLTVVPPEVIKEVSEAHGLPTGKD